MSRPDAKIVSGLIMRWSRKDIVHSKSVSEAKNEALNAVFDLVIFDMQLSDGTGFEVREILKGKNTAVIFLTVVDGEGNIVSTFEDGAGDYITNRSVCANCSPE